MTVESLVTGGARRMLPWFGAYPVGVDWIVDGFPRPPHVCWLGVWHSVIMDSLKEELEYERVEIYSPPRSGLPREWQETLLAMVRWEIAVAMELEIPRTYSPPSAVRDKLFAEFQNPFVPIVDIWRCGVRISGSFMNSDLDPIALHVFAGALVPWDQSGAFGVRRKWK